MQLRLCFILVEVCDERYVPVRLVDSYCDYLRASIARLRWNLYRYRILDLGISMADELKSLIEDAYDEGTLHPLFAAPVVQPDDSKDAERYRWLREENAKPYEEGSLFVGYDNDQGGEWIGCDLDAAIDAAMAAEKEQK